MVSIGPITSSFESLIKMRAPTDNTTHTNIVQAIPSPPVSLVFALKSKVARKVGLFGLL